MDPAARFGVSRWERLRTIDPRIRDTLLGVAALVVTLLATSVRDVTTRDSGTDPGSMTSEW